MRLLGLSATALCARALAPMAPKALARKPSTALRSATFDEFSTDAVPSAPGPELFTADGAPLMTAPCCIKVVGVGGAALAPAAPMGAQKKLRKILDVEAPKLRRAAAPATYPNVRHGEADAAPPP